MIEKEIETYLKITLNKWPSRNKIANSMSAIIRKDFKSLCDEHENLRMEFNHNYPELKLKNLQNGSYLDLKIRIAQKIFENCCFCERKCYVDRNSNKGYCNVLKPKIASEFIHMGEEAPLIPSHTIFFTGCNLDCIYCQNFDISKIADSGVEVSEERLANIIDRRRIEGAKNVNFVGGDPTPNLLFILKTMKLCNENVPVIWNSNFYMSEAAMKLLDGFVDLFLSDFKYGPSNCAEKLSDVKNYWEVVTRNHIMAKKAGDMIIRHLVLPGHVECCSKPILRWISKNLGNETVINIMSQYRPAYKANESSKIMRYPHIKEINEVRDFAHDIGLINIV